MSRIFSGVRLVGPRLIGAQLVLAGASAYLAIGGQPDPLGVAIAGTIAATVALGLAVVDADPGQAIVDFVKGAGAGAAVFFAVAVAARLPGAEKWTVYAQTYLMAIGVVPATIVNAVRVMFLPRNQT
jgi:hypothetical protein